MRVIPSNPAMKSHLHRPVAIIRDAKANPLAALVDDDVLFLEDHGTRGMAMGVCGRIIGREEVQRGKGEEGPVEGVLHVPIDGADRLVHSNQKHAEKTFIKY
jgi:hypothetical protein